MTYPYILALPSSMNNCPTYWQNFIASFNDTIDGQWGQVQTRHINKKLIAFDSEFIDDEEDLNRGDVLFKTEYGHLLFVLKYS